MDSLLSKTLFTKRGHMARRQMKSVQPKQKRRGNEFVGLFFLFLSAFLFLCLFSFNEQDPSFNQAVSSGRGVQNIVGLAGAYSAGFLVEMFGFGAMVWPFYFLYLGLSRFVSRIVMSKTRWLGFLGLFVALEAWAEHPWILKVPSDAYGLIGGGYFGHDIITKYSLPYLRPVGTFLLWLFVTIVSFQTVMGFSWSGLWTSFIERWNGYREIRAERRKLRRKRKELKKAEKAANNADKPEEMDLQFVDLESGNQTTAKPSAIADARANTKNSKKKALTKNVSSNGNLPTKELLTQPPPQKTSQTQDVLQPLANRLKECLNDFNVQGEIHRVVPGPVARSSILLKVRLPPTRI